MQGSLHSVTQAIDAAKGGQSNSQNKRGRHQSRQSQNDSSSLTKAKANDELRAPNTIKVGPKTITSLGRSGKSSLDRTENPEDYRWKHDL